MTHWQFNLRSGFDSDDDDDKPTIDSERSTNIPPSDMAANFQPNDTHDKSPSHIPIPTTTTTTPEDSTSKELRQLFGSADEETVQYKPNPWSIAKINANARATRDPAPSKPQNLKHGTQVVKRTWLPQPKAPKNSLRDAISAALRRDSAAAAVSATVAHDTAIIPDTHPSEYLSPERAEPSLLPPCMSLSYASIF
ncbi:hypothetical protein FRC09_000786 [Ceratobasidium sp. 395]|nr:hypothetical protein FRC09_000786 [Ceratobasidium sp. 395]